jgi:FkbM family methyltransferase
MNLDVIGFLKRIYWNLLGRWRRFRHPHSLSLSPQPALTVIARLLADRVRNVADPLVIVDGGAHDGVVARQFVAALGRAGVARPGVQVHAFEPNQDLHAQLRQSLRDVPGAAHVAALAAASGDVDLIVNRSPMTSSVLPRGALCERYFEELTRPQATRRVPAVALDDWFARSGLARVDLLKLDLQGYELEALRGAEELLRRGVACVYLEVHLTPGLYEGAAVFADIDAYLRGRGYRLHNLYNLCTHLPQGAIGSGDALYVFAGQANATATAGTVTAVRKEAA